MREKKLTQVASNLNYATGAQAGTPTKLLPPSDNFTDGKIPGQAFGAQWQNYLEYYLQKQVERSAQIPFCNWNEVPLIPALTTTPRFAYNPQLGATLIANGVNNSPKYIQDFPVGSAGAPLGITLAPGSGTFVPRCTVVLPPSVGGVGTWLVFGSNSTATTKTIWEITASTKTEVTSPVAGSIECACVDAVTGDVYAFAADASRSVLRRAFGSGTWSVIGTRGAGPSPTSATSFCAANNGVIVLADDAYGFHVVEKIVVSPFTRTLTTLGAADSATVFDCRWSPQLEAFMTLTADLWYVFADAAGTPQTFDATDPYSGAVMTGGCLTDTGAVGWVDNINWKSLAIRPWPGDAAKALKFGDFSTTNSTGQFVRYDGSALWFMTDTSGTKNLYRSLRSN